MSRIDDRDFRYQAGGEMEKRGNSGDGSRGDRGYYSWAAGIIGKCTNEKDGKRRRKTDQQDWVMLQSTNVVCSSSFVDVVFFCRRRSQTEGGRVQHVHAYRATGIRGFEIIYGVVLVLVSDIIRNK